MQTKQVICHAGQSVIATDGKVYTVAYTRNDQVWVYSLTGLRRIVVATDAWGGEHDQEIGLAA